MNASRQIKQRYLAQIRVLLSEHLEVLKHFEELWGAGRLREAYLAADDAIREFGLKFSPEQRKIDQDFYWDIVN